MFDVEYTDQFETWWHGLSIDAQDDVDQRIKMLIDKGPALGRPVVGAIKGSAFDPQMKELRISSGRNDFRVLFMFDPRRVAILLLGGSKTGQWNRWYTTAIPEADDLYRDHLAAIKAEEGGP